MKKYLKPALNILLYFLIYCMTIAIMVIIGFYLNLPFYFTQILGALAAILTIMLYILLFKLKKDNFFIHCNFTRLKFKDISILFLVVLSIDLFIIFLQFTTNLLPNMKGSPSVIALWRENQFIAFLVLCLIIPFFEEIFLED